MSPETEHRRASRAACGVNSKQRRRYLRTDENAPGRIATKTFEVWKEDQRRDRAQTTRKGAGRGYRKYFSRVRSSFCRATGEGARSLNSAHRWCLRLQRRQATCLLRFNLAASTMPVPCLLISQLPANRPNALNDATCRNDKTELRLSGVQHNGFLLGLRAQGIFGVLN